MSAGKVDLGFSRLGKALNRNIERELAGRTICDAYFVNEYSLNAATGELGPVFSEKYFERRFRTARAVHNCVHYGVLEFDRYFWEGIDFIGKKSATTH